MTKTIKSNTPARDALASHRMALVAKSAEVSELNDRRTQFVRNLAADRGRVSEMDAAKAAKKTDMGRVALGEAPAELLESIKSELAAATAEMPAVLQRIELAEAAIELLDAKLSPLLEAQRRLSANTDALEYAARVELAESRVEPYLAAFSQLANAHAGLLGACLAADDFARPHEGRPEVRAALYQTKLGIPLPKLPSLGQPGITLDLSAQIAEALAKVSDDLREPA
jgi:hypothetical protein